VIPAFVTGKTGWWWTSGAYDDAAGTWSWTNSGTTFAADDARWNAGEPGTGPWTDERVALQIDSQTLYSDATTFKNGVMCEAAAKH
jgi:hypothetical protein